MTTWNSGIHDRRLKEQICEIGRRVYNKGFAAANDGNISIRVGENEVLCSPTMICKGFMKPEDICAVDLYGNQIAGTRKRTSEVLLHLALMRARPEVKAVVHCHPPHATAFGVAREPIPQCVLPEVEVFLGEIPFAPYETPGGQDFADTVLPFLKPGTNAMILTITTGEISFNSASADLSAASPISGCTFAATVAVRNWFQLAAESSNFCSSHRPTASAKA